MFGLLCQKTIYKQNSSLLSGQLYAALLHETKHGPGFQSGKGQKSAIKGRHLLFQTQGV